MLAARVCESLRAARRRRGCRCRGNVHDNALASSRQREGSLDAACRGHRTGISFNAPASRQWNLKVLGGIRGRRGPVRGGRVAEIPFFPALPYLFGRLAGVETVFE